MARYQGLGIDIKALLEKMKSSMEKRGYRIERVLTGETSFLIEYKKSGMFGAKETISVKGVPDDLAVSGIRDDNEEAWFIVEDNLLSSAKNPQAFRSRTEQAAAAQAAPTPVAPVVPTAVPSPPPIPSAATSSIEKPVQPPPTNCTRCSAPLSVTQEDLIVTCRYCGFTMTTASREEIKQHSMLENRLFTQQVVDTAQKYMDKGVFRSGVSRDAQITNVKLRFIPFWVFPANTNTYFSGATGTGFMGEIHQAEEALTDKRASKLSKFGRLVKAGVSAYAETQQKDRSPTTVSSSFSSYYVWPILARKTMIREISYYDVPAARKIPFDIGKIPTDAEFLNTEYKEEEAKVKVKSEVEAKERLIASGKVDNLQTCSPNVSIGDGELVHAPIWFVHYSLKGEGYVILVDGGEGKVLGGGRPLFKFT
jgi:DNA-directed RNA polymerase subunit RPC12/RpoP